MTHLEFRAALKRSGMSLRGFCREILALGGDTLPYRTAQAWQLGESPIPAPVPALLTLMERHYPRNSSTTSTMTSTSPTPPPA